MLRNGLNDGRSTASAIEILTQPKISMRVGNKDAWRSERVGDEPVRPRAVHHAAGEGWNAERAVDEAPARMAAIRALPAPA